MPANRGLRRNTRLAVWLAWGRGKGRSQRVGVTRRRTGSGSGERWDRTPTLVRCYNSNRGYCDNTSCFLSETFGSSSKPRVGSHRKRSLSGSTPKAKRSKVTDGSGAKRSKVAGVKSRLATKKTRQFHPGKYTGSKFKTGGGRRVNKARVIRKMRTKK